MLIFLVLLQVIRILLRILIRVLLLAILNTMNIHNILHLTLRLIRKDISTSVQFC